MKRTTLLSAAALVCAAVLIAGPSWSAGLPALAGPMHNLSAASTPALTPAKAPAVYSAAQRSAAVAKFLNFNQPVNLDAAFSLTPARPSISGGLSGYVAYSKYFDASGVWAGSDDNSVPRGVVFFNWFPQPKDLQLPNVKLVFRIQFHKKYAIDCQFYGSHVHYEAWSTLPAGQVLSGDADLGGANHVVFATPAITPLSTSDPYGQLTVDLYLQGDMAGGQGKRQFYGCDISPISDTLHAPNPAAVPLHNLKIQPRLPQVPPH